MSNAKHNGVTKEEIVEILTHTAFYAGWPKVWADFRIAKDTGIVYGVGAWQIGEIKKYTCL